MQIKSLILIQNKMLKIELYKGDITKLEVDAIVNAANKKLLGGGGVDGAIHRAAGKELLEACKKLNGCETGDAKITLAYKLPSKFVIHAVGPIYLKGNESERKQLASCYYKSLVLAKSNEIESLAFPNISTGAYGYPKIEAAQIAVNTVLEFLAENPEIKSVVFCVFDEENYTIYKKLLK